jgi:outer membrane receptor for ferrienterochelin and colicin
VGELVQATWRPFSRLELIGGLRVQSDLLLGTTFDPRVMAKLELIKAQPGAESLALKAGVGLFHAPPPLVDLDPSIGNPALAQTQAMHLMGGLDWRPTRTLLLSVQGFYVDLSNAVVTSSDTTTRNGATVPLNLTEATGHSAGLEVFVQQRLWHGLEGWASYTLSRSELTTSTSASPISSWDQTHVLAAQLSYALPLGFTVAARFQYASGTPTTLTTGSLFDATSDSYLPLYGTVLGDRTTPFRQLDLKVEKAWKVGDVTLAAYLDVRNVTNAQNVVSSPLYNFDSSQSATQTGLPILPIVGVRLSE